METMMSDIVLGIVLGIAIGAWLFYIGIKIVMARLIARIEGDLEQALEQAKEESIPCRVEQHNEIFFMYNNDTNEFMAQGSDLKELCKHIRSRWANRKVSVVAGDNAVLETLRTQLNESSNS
jgi:hypothetical protein